MNYNTKIELHKFFCPIFNVQGCNLFCKSKSLIIKSLNKMGILNEKRCKNSGTKSLHLETFINWLQKAWESNKNRKNKNC